MMDGDRVAEHVSAITDNRDDHSFGGGELRAQRRSRSPAEARRGAGAEIAAGVLERAVLEEQRVLIDDDRPLVLGAIQAMADPDRIDG